MIEIGLVQPFGVVIFQDFHFLRISVGFDDEVFAGRCGDAIEGTRMRDPSIIPVGIVTNANGSFCESLDRLSGQRMYFLDRIR